MIIFVASPSPTTLTFSVADPVNGVQTHAVNGIHTTPYLPGILSSVPVVGL